jgi:hypothetical protein
MGLSAGDKIELERLEADAERLPVELRTATFQLARTIIAFCPEGRERMFALDRLRECAMWAHSAMGQPH